MLETIRPLKKNQLRRKITHLRKERSSLKKIKRPLKKKIIRKVSLRRKIQAIILEREREREITEEKPLKKLK